MRWKHISINDCYRKIKKISLADYCPSNLIRHFDDARNLYLYSYYHYRFCMIARRELITALELAFKQKAKMLNLKNNVYGLKDLTDALVANKLINDKNIKKIRSTFKSVDDFYKLMADYRILRNELSHGSDMIYPTVMQEFVDVKNIINLLFKH